MLIRKPMLAASMEHSNGTVATFKDLVYPLGASIKLDGIRCLRVGRQTLSRSFKLIPNKYIQAQMSDLIDGLDGELVTYNTDGKVRAFNEIQGDIMRGDGMPSFKFEVFDYVDTSLSTPYIERIKNLQKLQLPHFCSLVLPTIINNETELLAYEEKALAEGHEGIMTRSLKGEYKCGRATFKSQDLIKIKRFVDSEALIIGLEEKLHNANEATTDELGRTKRSSAKDGLVPANTLGAFNVRDIHDGREFSIGTGIGLNDELKKLIWNNKAEYMGKIIKYRYQQVGTKDNPRIPSFQGFRDPRDMS